MRIEGAVFDLDGVLTDTEKIQFEGWAEVLKDLEVVLERGKYFKYSGKTGTNVDKELIEDHGLSVEPGTLRKKKEKLIIDWLNSRSLELLPYAMESIDFFRKKGLKVAVATGSLRHEAEVKVKKTGLEKLLDALVTRSDVENGKPHPEIYLKACRTIRIKPERCVAFEDTLSGARSAKNAGMICIAVPGEFTRDQDFSFADYEASDLKDAMEWVRKSMD